MISDIAHHNPLDMGGIYVSGAILLLAIAILVVRYASARFPGISVIEQSSPARTHPENIEDTER